MNKIIDIPHIISQLTGRAESLFSADIEQNKEKLITEIKNKNIIVIGGAGTIGSSFIKAILRVAKPNKVVIVDNNENGLTEVIRDIRSSNNLHIPETLLTYPINFTHPIFKKIFLQHAPFDIVANFAAHKHVRSEKDIFSIEAMINNNIIDAYYLLKFIAEHKPKHFFCVSTDKAANPVNIMGASKKIMEMLIMAFAHKFKITTARFANVAFSNGSLPIGFIERILKKQPLSVPTNVKRFFVSPVESGEICMMACLLGNNKEIYFPKLDAEKDMHTFTTIVELLLQQLKLAPSICNSEQEAREKMLAFNKNSNQYPVYYFTSDTSGEKPYEEFYTENEELDTTTFQQLGFIKNYPIQTFENIKNIIREFEQLFQKNNLTKQKIVDLLSNYIPNFSHIETGKNLDQKM